MSLRAFFALTLSLAAASLRAQSAAGIEFNGVLVSGGKTTVSLVNPATGESRWIAVGRKFGDRTVTAYNAADAKAGRPADTVVLTRDSDGRSETITLKGAPVVTTAPTATPSGAGANAPAGRAVETMAQLPPGARLLKPLDPTRPTEIGQTLYSEQPASNGTIQLTAVSLEGFAKIEDGSGDFVYQPIYSIREMNLASEDVAKRKAAEAQLRSSPATPPQPTTSPAKTP